MDEDQTVNEKGADTQTEPFEIISEAMANAEAEAEIECTDEEEEFEYE